MARKPTTREWVLLVVVAIVGLLALWIQDPGKLGLGGGPGTGGVEARELGEPPVVLLAKLEPVQEAYDPDGRNLFEYYTPPPPRPVRPQPVERKPPPPKPQVRQEQPKPQPQTQVVRPTGPRPPRISFKYLGFLGHKDNKLAVFEDGDEIVLGRVGQTVFEQFKVVEFQYEKIVMGYVDEQFADQTTDLKQSKGR